MQAVITVKQAKAITGGRTPLVPVVYEEAITALGACLSLDDAKEWADKADALAAWAKIYRDNTVERQARALKLRAYQRMGLLARELRPNKAGAMQKGGVRLKGPTSLLVDTGMTPAAAKAAMSMSLPHAHSIVDKAVDSPRPPSPITLTHQITRPTMDSKVRDFFVGGGSFHGLRSKCRANPPTEVWAVCSTKERESLIAVVQEIADWCDAFLQAAGK